MAASTSVVPMALSGLIRALRATRWSWMSQSSLRVSVSALFARAASMAWVAFTLECSKCSEEDKKAVAELSHMGARAAARWKIRKRRRETYYPFGD